MKIYLCEGGMSSTLGNISRWARWILRCKNTEAERWNVTLGQGGLIQGQFKDRSDQQNVFKSINASHEPMDHLPITSPRNCGETSDNTRWVDQTLRVTTMDSDTPSLSAAVPSASDPAFYGPRQGAAPVADPTN